MSKQYKAEELFPSTKFIHHRKVAIFDEHESPGHGGRPKKITKEDLLKLADNCNKKFELLGCPTGLMIGHTKDDADEQEQGPIIGWATNFVVDKLGNTDKYGLFCDWHIKNKYKDAIEEFPHRSIELWKSRHDIEPISLLRTAPERTLPIIRYSKTQDSNDSCYRYTYTPPSPSQEPIAMNDEQKKMVTEAVADESSDNKQLMAEVANLKDQVMQLSSMMQELMSVLHEGGDEDQDQDDTDLLDQAGDDGDSDEDDKGDDKKKAKDTDKAADGDEAKKYEAAMAGPGNTFTPEMEKTKMSREEDAVKFERMAKKLVADATATLMKENEELRVKFNRTQAEKEMNRLESEHNVDFGSAEDREEETQLLTDMLTHDKTGEAFKVHTNKIARKYKRKEAATPDSKGASRALQFARVDDDKPAFGSADDVLAFTRALASDPEMTPAKWAEKKLGKKS